MATLKEGLVAIEAAKNSKTIIFIWIERLLFPNVHEIGAVTISILQMREPRRKEKLPKIIEQKNGLEVKC